MLQDPDLQITKPTFCGFTWLMWPNLGMYLPVVEGMILQGMAHVPGQLLISDTSGMLCDWYKASAHKVLISKGESL